MPETSPLMSFGLDARQCGELLMLGDDVGGERLSREAKVITSTPLGPVISSVIAEGELVGAALVPLK